MNHKFRSKLQLVVPDLILKVQQKQSQQKLWYNRHCKKRSFYVGNTVLPGTTHVDLLKSGCWVWLKRKKALSLSQCAWMMERYGNIIKINYSINMKNVRIKMTPVQLLSHNSDAPVLLSTPMDTPGGKKQVSYLVTLCEVAPNNSIVPEKHVSSESMLLHHFSRSTMEFLHYNWTFI